MHEQRRGFGGRRTAGAAAEWGVGLCILICPCRGWHRARPLDASLQRGPLSGTNAFHLEPVCMPRPTSQLTAHSPRPTADGQSRCSRSRRYFVPPASCVVGFGMNEFRINGGRGLSSVAASLLSCPTPFFSRRLPHRILSRLPSCRRGTRQELGGNWTSSKVPSTEWTTSEHRVRVARHG